MSDEQRDKLWYVVNDRGGELREIEVQADVIDMEINGLQRLQYQETKQRLQRLGINTANYREPPPLHRSELLSANHPTGDELEALVTQAQKSKLQKMYEEHVAPSGEAPLIRRDGCGQVLGVR